MLARGYEVEHFRLFHRLITGPLKPGIGDSVSDVIASPEPNLDQFLATSPNPLSTLPTHQLYLLSPSRARIDSVLESAASVPWFRSTTPLLKLAVAGYEGGADSVSLAFYHDGTPSSYSATAPPQSSAQPARDPSSYTYSPQSHLQCTKTSQARVSKQGMRHAQGRRWCLSQLRYYCRRLEYRCRSPIWGD